MKETSFIDQNKEKWKKFQTLAANESADPEELADLYTDITDDLSYAQTFYSKRTVRVFLNQIAQSIHNLVHKERSESLKKFITVWRVSLPLEIYRSRKNIQFAFWVFLFWAVVGAFSTWMNPDFPRLIMGDYYVDKTIQNINNNDPLAVYHDKFQLAMFFRITLNNIQVAFYSFIFGILFTIGTHIFLMKNAIMLGSFQWFFKMKGLLITSFLGIWIHGAFEISALVIAAGAGITLGNGLLFPGSYTRLQSLQLSAKRGLKIMMSLVPFLICAGFLESYVTHNYQSLAEWSKWLIILFSFALIVFYYVVYPVIVARKYPELVYESKVPYREVKNTFDVYRLRTFGQSFSDSFSFYRVHIMRIVKTNLLISAPIVLAMMVFQDVRRFQDITHQYEYDWISQMRILTGVDLKTGWDWLMILGWTIVLAQLITTVMYSFKHQTEAYSLRKMVIYNYKHLPATWLLSLLVFLCLFLVPVFWNLLFLFIVPLFVLVGHSMASGEGSFSTRVKEGFSFSTNSYGSQLIALGAFLFMFFVFIQPIAFVLSYQVVGYMNDPAVPDLLDVLASFTKNVSRYYTNEFVAVSNVVRQIVYLLFGFFILPIYFIQLGFLYYDMREKQNAVGLRKSFESFGKRRRTKETPADFE